MAKETEVKTEAQLRVTSPNGDEIVRTFNKAWKLALELPRPVHVEFIGFVRKEGI